MQLPVTCDGKLGRGLETRLVHYLTILSLVPRPSGYEAKAILGHSGYSEHLHAWSGPYFQYSTYYIFKTFCIVNWSCFPQ